MVRPCCMFSSNTGVPRSHRTLLAYVSSLYCLDISVLLVSSFIRFAYICATWRHRFLAAPQPPRRPYFYHFCRFASFRPRRFTTTALCTYPENPPRLISSRASHSVPLLPAHPDHIYPLQPKLEECGLLREKFFHPFWMPFRRHGP